MTLWDGDHVTAELTVAARRLEAAHAADGTTVRVERRLRLRGLVEGLAVQGSACSFEAVRVRPLAGRRWYVLTPPERAIAIVESLLGPPDT
jgi:hypothetical protein